MVLEGVLKGFKEENEEYGRIVKGLDGVLEKDKGDLKWRGGGGGESKRIPLNAVNVGDETSVMMGAKGETDFGKLKEDLLGKFGGRSGDVNGRSEKFNTKENYGLEKLEWQVKTECPGTGNPKLNNSRFLCRREANERKPKTPLNILASLPGSGIQFVPKKAKFETCTAPNNLAATTAS